MEINLPGDLWNNLSKLFKSEKVPYTGKTLDTLQRLYTHITNYHNATTTMTSGSCDELKKKIKIMLDGLKIISHKEGNEIEKHSTELKNILDILGGITNCEIKNELAQYHQIISQKKVLTDINEMKTELDNKNKRKKQKNEMILQIERLSEEAKKGYKDDNSYKELSKEITKFEEIIKNSSINKCFDFFQQLKEEEDYLKHLEKLNNDIYVEQIKDVREIINKLMKIVKNNCEFSKIAYECKKLNPYIQKIKDIITNWKKKEKKRNIFKKLKIDETIVYELPNLKVSIKNYNKLCGDGNMNFDDLMKSWKELKIDIELSRELMDAHTVFLKLNEDRDNYNQQTMDEQRTRLDEYASIIQQQQEDNIEMRNNISELEVNLSLGNMDDNKAIDNMTQIIENLYKTINELKGDYEELKKDYDIERDIYDAEMTDNIEQKKKIEEQKKKIEGQKKKIEEIEQELTQKKEKLNESGERDEEQKRISSEQIKNLEQMLIDMQKESKETDELLKKREKDIGELLNNKDNYDDEKNKLQNNLDQVMKKLEEFKKKLENKTEEEKINKEIKNELTELKRINTKLEKNLKIKEQEINEKNNKLQQQSSGETKEPDINLESTQIGKEITKLSNTEKIQKFVNYLNIIIESKVGVVFTQYSENVSKSRNINIDIGEVNVIFNDLKKIEKVYKNQKNKIYEFPKEIKKYLLNNRQKKKFKYAWIILGEILKKYKEKEVVDLFTPPEKGKRSATGKATISGRFNYGEVMIRQHIFPKLEKLNFNKKDVEERIDDLYK